MRDARHLAPAVLGPSRPAKTRAADSASSRRATNANTSSDSESRRCASSTAHTTGSVSAGRGQQAQHPQADQETVRRRAIGDARGDPERLPVPSGSEGSVSAERDHQALQGRERDRRLGLVAVDPEHLHARDACGRGSQQCCLADSRLTADQQRSATSVTCLSEQAADPLLAPGTAEDDDVAHGR